MLRSLASAVVALTLLPALASTSLAGDVKASAVDESMLQAFEWRSIGPFRGGRVTAVAGVSGQPLVYYFGSTGGGVWKTTDAGNSWQPLTDGQVGTGSVGAVAVAP
ncbi:MAG: glycosyl hydrolase repeat-containing protein, partial [Acidobacteria bacterium]|nr:glycosyl hydrolase repeat-containing protein [Acidobacteriota bacterium]